jgi:hypothetical protein
LKPAPVMWQLIPRFATVLTGQVRRRGDRASLDRLVFISKGVGTNKEHNPASPS